MQKLKNLEKEKNYNSSFVEKLLNSEIIFNEILNVCNNKLASNDHRVLGHRHEQTAMSVEAIKMNMNKWANSENEWFVHDREYVKDVSSTVDDINMTQ